MRPLTKPIHGGNYVVIERRSSVSTQLPRGTSDTQKYLLQPDKERALHPNRIKYYQFIL